MLRGALEQAEKELAEEKEAHIVSMMRCMEAHDENLRLLEEKQEADRRLGNVHRLVLLAAAQCGIPSKEDALTHVVKTLREALEVFSKDRRCR